HCKNSPRSNLVIEMFTPVVQRILKHNMDFGKYPRMRMFVQDYILALNSQNEGLKVVQNFVTSMHGPASTCPHPRVLPNLVSVCLSAIYSCFEERQRELSTLCGPVLCGGGGAPCVGDKNSLNRSLQDLEEKVQCFAAIFSTMCVFEDWRPGLGSLLQPIPFPDEALSHDKLLAYLRDVTAQLAADPRCAVHLSLLGIRENKEGWFQLFCPGGLCANDEGDTFLAM
ncbi:PREDICTED: C-Maf-inducing protein-like, partial [Priapulus caudatus]|uniref:C-Maf-inducing protein-like n=1 Tax=Priapulus caudatus TaxID=37621 RepID=A0ABM1F5L0_PRICU